MTTTDCVRQQRRNPNDRERGRFVQPDLREMMPGLTPLALLALIAIITSIAVYTSGWTVVPPDDAL